MAETQSKRQREEEDSHEPEQPLEFEDSNSKRHKPYDNILSILDEEPEENEPNQDLSAIFSTFQNELSTTTTTTTATTDAEQDYNPSSSAAAAAGGKEEEDDSIKVIRHLLEASDDELGIPNPNNGVDEEINSGDFNGFNASFDGFWELEDDAANYYTVLQSELFM